MLFMIDKWIKNGKTVRKFDACGNVIVTIDYCDYKWRWVVMLPTIYSGHTSTRELCKVFADARLKYLGYKPINPKLAIMS